MAISSVGSVSSAGIGSGLDVESIVSQLMAIEKKPLTALQTKATSIQNTISEYGKIKGAVSTLKDLATKLASSTSWNQTTATSSDDAVAATTNAAATGSYTVAVSKLASAQTLASAKLASPTSTVGSGTLRIELGSWNAGQTSFTPKSGATAVDVTIAASDKLTDVRDKINAAGAGVTAMVMTDSTGSRLLLSSSATGAANGFRTSGVAALAFDPSAGANAMTQSQAAADAQATLNGLAITSPTNTFADIVDGLTLNLTATTTDPATVTIATDAAALKKTITDFAAAYSAVVKLIADDTKYDAVSKKGGLLQGDSAANGLARSVRALAGLASGASSSFARLSDVGLEIQSDGSMTVNAGKLDKALGNLPELKKAFSSSIAGDASKDGFAKRFRDVTTAMLGTDGALSSRTDGLGRQLTRNQKDQDSLSVRLEGIEKRMRAQYTALDTKMAALSSQSSYVIQQMTAWAKSSD